ALASAARWLSAVGCGRDRATPSGPCRPHCLNDRSRMDGPFERRTAPQVAGLWLIRCFREAVRAAPPTDAVPGRVRPPTREVRSAQAPAGPSESCKPLPYRD